MDVSGYPSVWRHVVISTHCSWKPGDKRGWRSRGHKRHSSGDYKQQPPEDEHEGLRRWADERSGTVVTIPVALRCTVGDVLIEQMKTQGYPPIVCAVDGRHAHMLVKLPDDPPSMRSIVGEAKKVASRSIRKQLPGKVWGAAGKFKRIRDRQHQINTFKYILYEQGPNAWAWSERDGVVHDPAQH